MTVITDNNAEVAGKRAAAYFGNGFHCAEAVVAAVLETIGEEPGMAAAHATAFGGGFGRTFAEACGALAGGLIVIGHMHGRKIPKGDWDVPAILGDQLRQRFIGEFASTHCATLRQRFGDENQMKECRNIVEQVATSLVDLLAEQKALQQSSNND